jgi:hypothetical protein
LKKLWNAHEWGRLWGEWLEFHALLAITVARTRNLVTTVASSSDYSC